MEGKRQEGKKESYHSVWEGAQVCNIWEREEDGIYGVGVDRPRQGGQGGHGGVGIGAKLGQLANGGGRQALHLVGGQLRELDEFGQCLGLAAAPQMQGTLHGLVVVLGAHVALHGMLVSRCSVDSLALANAAGSHAHGAIGER